MKRNIELVKATISGDIEKVKNILKITKEFEYDELDIAMHYAFIKKNNNIIKLLLKSGAKFHEKLDKELLNKQKIMISTDYGEELLEENDPLLDYFYKENDFEGIKLLVENGYDPKNILDLCVQGNDSEKLKYLLDIDIHFDNTNYIKFASEKAYIEILKLLVKDEQDFQKISGNYRELIIRLFKGNFCINDSDYEDYFIEACINGNTEIVKSLLENGIDPNYQTNNSFTPLMLACINGHLEIVKLLVYSGADINKINEYESKLNPFIAGVIALTYAVKYNYFEILKFLISCGSYTYGYVYNYIGSNANELLEKAGAKR